MFRFNKNHLYEINEKGDRMLVRSIESVHRVYLRFTNLTQRPVNIWWRNFVGDRRFYVRLDPGAFYDVNSFVTHPWEFTDVTTRENYVINNRIIYRPPANIGGMMYRTNWNITIPMRTLRQTALMAIAMKMKAGADVQDLSIPKVLILDLQKLYTQLNASTITSRASH